MSNYRGTIKNEKGLAIFCKKGRFENELKCLEALHKEVNIDLPSELDSLLIYRNSLCRTGISFSYKPLADNYKNKEELEFFVELV